MKFKRLFSIFFIVTTYSVFGQIDSKKLIVGSWKSVGKDTLWRQIIITKGTWQADNKAIGKYKIKASDFLHIRWTKENAHALFEIVKINNDSLYLKGIGGENAKINQTLYLFLRQ